MSRPHSMPTRTSDDVERPRSPPESPIAARRTIHAGRNRQVRRMCAAVGHPVRRLVRARIGPLRDQHLAPGEWRHLSRLSCCRCSAVSRPAPRWLVSFATTLMTAGVGRPRAPKWHDDPHAASSVQEWRWPGG